jgi:predicted transcriptional regulator
VSYAQSAAVQELSKIMFGQKNRLAVMVAIADSDGVVNPGELAVQLGFRAQSAIQQSLQDLQSVGLIERMEASSASRATFYRRNDGSVAWELARELLAHALGDSAATRRTLP